MPSRGETVKEPQNLVDFSADGPGWRVINDGVMGGLSLSGIRRSSDGTGIFAGELSLENNGGFASVRSTIGPRDLSPFYGLEIRVRGDGRFYQLRLRTDQGMDGIAYRASFGTQTGKWFTARIPFEEFLPTFRGRVVDGAPRLDVTRIHQLGFLIADKKTGTIQLEIDYVQGWNPETETP